MKKIQFQLNAKPTLTDFNTLVLPVFTHGQSISAAADFGVNGLIDALDKQDDFKGKTAQTLMLHHVAQLDCPRLLLVGMGDQEKLTEKGYLSAIQAMSKTLENSGATQVLDTCHLATPKGQNQSWSLYQNSLILQRSFYDYSHESRGEHKAKNPHLNQVCFMAEDNTAHQQSIAQGQASAIGMALTQDLANMPSNFCTPTYLADTAVKLGQQAGFKVTLLERAQMIEMGMGSFMAVAQGTDTPPKMICIEYQGGAAEQAPIALVGKGVTFDTGGISLKPGASMDEMKYDMGGAATVMGVFQALAELKPAINVVGVIPATENMPSGNAIKPGDVVRSLSGQTIEILNTDAEGRLILCDALTYAQQTYQPGLVVDIATLTGACIIALGHHVSGVLGNDQDLVNQLLEAGKTTYDRCWQLPLGEEWDEQLKSNFADMANIGGREGGTITAAQFLARFTKQVKWAHLDIAGTAWQSGANKGASGRPVPMLVEFIMQQVNK
ncbi:leucyl aminopeptidase [Thiomicrospira microaerophila]|uniref:leucyl aminopeptidase n=1 Tax=Thiomicrospira microaerophila TaxID=406020 RepID=UPI0005C84D0A|nr:leucyl aminopeptidase [Thiomicrospira microaerophila]